jgi:ATP-dependent Clp protease ATP-binding subunit ClpA
MPFLTDRIEDNKRKLAEGDRLDQEEARCSDLPDFSATSIYKSRYSFTPEGVRSELEQTVFGQKNAIDLIVDIMKVTCVGLSDPRKPIASILFTGPTGVGKTESVRSVARAIHGTSEALCRIDMNTLSQEHYAAAFSGSPPGYVGSKEGMTLLDQEKIEGSSRLPGIVLFDELEKASKEVVLALMNILDNGILTVASGERTISFRNTIIFMTSNLSASATSSRLSRISRSCREAFWSVGGDQEHEQNSNLTTELLKVYPPEFVNRIDHVQQLLPLGKSAMNTLVSHQVQLLNQRLSARNIHVEIGEDVAHFLASKGFDARFGARELRRVFRSAFEFPLARMLVEKAPVPEESGLVIEIAAKMSGATIRFVPTTLPART